MKQIVGTGVALVTPFKKDLSVDTEGLKKLTRFVIDGGVDFLVVLGTTGESATLNETEQDHVIQTVIETNAGQLPVVIGCGGNNTGEVANKMKALQLKWKPAAFLSVCPYYNKPSQKGLELHFSAIAAANPDAAIILYNVPGRTSCNLLPETTLRLARNTSQFISIKEASGNVEQMMNIIEKKPEGFELLSGDDNLCLPVMALGGKGVISVAANALPTVFSSIARLASQGNYDAARKAHYRINTLMQLNFAEGNPASVKMMLNILGICEPWVRLPLAPATDSLKQEITAALKAADLL